MTPPVSPFAFRLRLAGAALLWERLWPAAAPAAGIVGLFLILALFDLPARLPAPAHAVLLVILAAALIWAGMAAFRAVAIPSRAAAMRRLERASGLAHQPLLALEDRPSGALDADAAALWQEHRRRMAVALGRLRVGWPRAGLAPRDPWGMRALLAMLLIIGAADARDDWRERLGRSLSPDFAGRSTAVAASLDIWVTPPDYTGLAPQFLQPGATEPIRVPTGSALLAQVHGGGDTPVLALDGAAHDFDAVDKQNFRAAATLSSGSRLKVSQAGGTLGEWRLAIVPDLPPEVSFSAPPKGTARNALQLDYKASDDYGIESLRAVIRRQGGTPDETLDLELPLPGLHLREAHDTNFHDLTAHPWAGLPVEIELVATDALGQAGKSTPARLTLPERNFTHPIARAIIDQRRQLAADPGTADVVAEILGDLRSRPQLYRDDKVVFLGLSMAEEQLRAAPSAAGLAETQQLLWDLALRIEDGRMSLAERELRRLQQQLQDAIAKNAPDAEIDRLAREVQQALDRYLQALAENMQRNPDQQSTPLDPSRMVTGRDLQRMIDRARELARNGERDKARELLSQLQQMLENLRMAQPGQMQQQQDRSNRAQQMMRGMQDMMRRQQQLLDRSFRAQRQPGQRGQPGQQGRRGQPGQRGEPGQGEQGQGEQGEGDQGDMADAAGQQEALRRMLGEMMRGMGDGAGEIPDSFGRAERAMRDAGQALQRGSPGNAIGPQSEALDQLQQAARDFAQRMQQQMGGPSGDPGDNETGATDQEQRDRVDRDPLGRPTSNTGTFDQGDVRLPEQTRMQKSREILDELRRRAGERSRPEMELDYIDRLLKRF